MFGLKLLLANLILIAIICFSFGLDNRYLKIAGKISILLLVGEVFAYITAIFYFGDNLGEFLTFIGALVFGAQFYATENHIIKTKNCIYEHNKYNELNERNGELSREINKIKKKLDDYYSRTKDSAGVL